MGGLRRGANRKLKGEDQDRINILLLGVGGSGHEGPELSDTIIIGSLEPSSKKISLISVPRDLYVPIKKYGWKKINHANAYGEMEKKGYGGKLASQTIEKIFDIPIHYYVKIDFNGFKQIINDVGGIKIYVDNAFSDNQYPDDNFGYEPVSFKKGWQTMDGDRALKYARSRHGNNNEGSDFSRSKRQQKILLALKEKMSGFSFWSNPKKIGRVIASLKNHIDTNMEPWEILNLGKIIKKSDLKKINHIVLTTGDSGQLYATNINGAYVLLPKGNDFTILKTIARNAFDFGTVAGAVEKKKLPPSIDVRNGTKISGLAARTAQMLKQYGFKITKIGNADTNKKIYSKTIIYDLSGNKYPEQLNFLKNKFNATVRLSVPDWLMSKSFNKTEITLEKTPIKSSADFIIILGKNANQ